jgi:hypothetical protein
MLVTYVAGILLVVMANSPTVGKTAPTQSADALVQSNVERLMRQHVPDAVCKWNGLFSSCEYREQGTWLNFHNVSGQLVHATVAHSPLEPPNSDYVRVAGQLKYFLSNFGFSIDEINSCFTSPHEPGNEIQSGQLILSCKTNVVQGSTFGLEADIYHN